MRLRMKIKFWIFFLGFVSLSIGIASQTAESEGSALFDPPQGVRDKLTFDDLMNGNYPELVHNDYFMAIGSDAPAIHPLSGVIHFSETTMDTTHSPSTWAGGGMRSGEKPLQASPDGRCQVGITLSAIQPGPAWAVMVGPISAVRMSSTAAGISLSSAVSS